MCTSISFPAHALFGRTLDLETSFGEQVVVTPRNYAFHFHHRPSVSNHFAMIGMASVVNQVPLYAEAANEKGLYMAGLNFQGNAFYFEQTDPGRCLLYTSPTICAGLVSSTSPKDSPPSSLDGACSGRTRKTTSLW